MDGEATTTPDPEAATPRKTRAPADPEARARIAERSKVRRLIAKVGESKDESEFFAKLDELRGRKPAAAGQVVESPKVSPWEDPAKLAEVTPGLAAFWSGLLGLYPEAYRPQPVVVGKDAQGHEVELRPEMRLAAGTAPWVVQVGAEAMATPKVTGLATVALVLLGPTAAMVWGEVIRPWWTARKERKAAAPVEGAQG